MTTKSTFLLILRRSCVVGAIVGAAVLFGPASAHKDPVTPEQLKAYQDAFMEEVRKGDLLFHGDGATAKKMGVNLSDTGMACAMPIPWAPIPTRTRSRSGRCRSTNSRRCAT